MNISFIVYWYLSPFFLEMWYTNLSILFQKLVSNVGRCHVTATRERNLFENSWNFSFHDCTRIISVLVRCTHTCTINTLNYCTQAHIKALHSRLEATLSRLRQFRYSCLWNDESPMESNRNCTTDDKSEQKIEIYFSIHYLCSQIKCWNTLVILKACYTDPCLLKCFLFFILISHRTFM